MSSVPSKLKVSDTFERFTVSRFGVWERLPFYKLPEYIPKTGLGTRQARILARKSSDIENSWKPWILLLEAFCFRNSEGFEGEEKVLSVSNLCEGDRFSHVCPSSRINFHCCWRHFIFILDADKGLFEGDMQLNPRQRELVKNGGDVSSAGKPATAFGSTKQQQLLWLPSKTVPYVISPGLGKNKLKKFVLSGRKIFHIQSFISREKGPPSWIIYK